MSFTKQIVAVFILLSSMLLHSQAHAGVEITFLGNAGYLLSDGKDKIIIDGFLGESYALFEGLDEKSIAPLVSAKGDFSGIDLALASHRHFEHFQPDTACKFIKASKDTLLVTSAQVITILKERCKPFAKTHPNVVKAGVQTLSKTFSKDGVEVEIFPLSHGVGKFALLEHYGHLMTVGGKTILHIGDAAATPADFIAAGLQNRKLDIVLAPYTFYTRAAGKLIVAQYLNAPIHIVGHIPPKEHAEIVAAVMEDFPDAIVFGARMDKFNFDD